MANAPDDITAAKIALRRDMKARRAAIGAQERAAAAAQVADHALRWLGANAHDRAICSGFLSIGDELGTMSLLGAMHQAGYRLCLPVMQGKGRPLIFRAWAPGDEMDTVAWGIQEPTAARLALSPQVLFVPLLAVDPTGHRLGYGGGFYDRTIRELRSKALITAIGIGFDAQKVDAVPHLDYDEPLDWVLTPSGPSRAAPGA